MDLRSPVHIAGIRLANPLMNGAYIGSKTAEDCAVLAESAAGAAVVQIAIALVDTGPDVFQKILL